MKKLSVVLFAFSIISCGGGDGSSSSTVSLDSNPRQILRTFSDESGIGRLESPDGETHHYYFRGVEIQQWVDEYSPSDPGNATDYSRVTKNRELQYADEYDGTVLINGQDYDFLGYIDQRSEVRASYIYSNEFREDAIISGSTVSEIPIGRFLYSGQNILTGEDLDYYFIGTFGINVDFSSGIGSVTGLTYGTTGDIVGSRITGTFEIDGNNGNFSSDKKIMLTTYNFMDGTNPIEYKASMNGSFHGLGATGVSAIYYTEIRDNYVPNLWGTIVGARVD